MDEVIKRGISYLDKNIERDGSFKSYSSYLLDFSNSETHFSPFYSALILSSLQSLNANGEVSSIKRAISKFLMSQKSKDLTFNYWSRGSTDSKKQPYPDDLDVTFCVLSSLFLYDKKIINGKVIAKAVDVLTAFETKEGGPYRTWIVPENSSIVWKDVDIAVNSNIAFFLSLIDVDLPNINKLIENGFRNNSLLSPYYYSAIPVIYFISRFYKGELRKEFIELLLSLKTSIDWWGNPLLSSLAVSAMINFSNNEEEVLEKTIRKIISLQSNNGRWGIYPFVIEKKTENATLYAGSSSLTTAFCLEAIGKYIKVREVNRYSSVYDSKEDLVIQKEIINQVKKSFRDISTEMGVWSNKIMEKTSKMDKKNHITLLPVIISSALEGNAKILNKKFLADMGIANLYGWIAYTIYDDFLDSEGDPRMLSVANVALRKMCQIFDTFSIKYPEFKQIFKQLMDNIDTANIWESINCKNPNAENLPDFGDYKVISDKSIGIALTPIAILIKIGFEANSKEVKSILSFFKHYLIARQLNDDAHDWESDIKTMQATPVTNLIINLYKKNKKRTYQEIFWYEVVIEVCRSIDEHIVHAKKSLLKISCFKNTEVFDNLLKPLEKAVEKTLDEQRKTIEFLSTYKSTKVQ